MQKSRSCRPSASQRDGPFPLTMNRGVPPTDRNARTGLSTPPTRLSNASAKSRSDSDAGGSLPGSDPMSDPQGVEHLLRRGEDTREDRRFPLRVLARLARAELHDEVEEVERVVRLERQHELLVIQAERVGRVNRHVRVLVPHAEVIPHDALPPFERDRVPLPFLDERVHEQVPAPERRGTCPEAVLPSVGVAAQVLGSLARREIGVHGLEVVAEFRRGDPPGHLPERLQTRVDDPHHEVRVGPDPLERVAPEGDLFLEVVDERRELRFLFLLPLRIEELPFGSDLVERVLEELARSTRFLGGARLVARRQLRHGRPSRCQWANAFAWYVRMRSAPARRIAVSVSSTTGRSSTHPRSAAALIRLYSPLTANAASGASNRSRAARITSRYARAGFTMTMSAPSSRSRAISRSDSRRFAGSFWYVRRSPNRGTESAASRKGP